MQMIPLDVHLPDPLESSYEELLLEDSFVSEALKVDPNVGSKRALTLEEHEQIDFSEYLNDPENYSQQPSPLDDAVCPEGLLSRSTSPSPSPFPSDHGCGGSCGHSSRKRANGHSCGKRPEDFPSLEAWEKYRNRRMRNNEAAIRSRQRKRSRQTEASTRIVELETANKQLLLKVESLQDEVNYMRKLVMQFTSARQSSALPKTDLPEST